MNVAIIGTGQFANAIAGLLSRTRNGVVFGARTSEAGHEAAEQFVQRHQRAVQGGSIAEAIAVSDAVILAVPASALEDVLELAGSLASKTVLDPINPTMKGHLGADLSGPVSLSVAEQIQHKRPKACMVKAFNTLFSALLENKQSYPGRLIQTFLASDNEAAKTVAARLAGDIGLEPIDVGPLSSARYLEPLGALNIHMGLEMGHGTAIAPTWVGLDAA